ncbi:MAG TPA: BON domain-containing protein [Pirellulaceae bacterium]|nr:BON domain-containing protein [Pirellulaceae bacterium]
MRITCLLLVAVGLIGCGRIDSSRTNTGVDTSPPTITRPDDGARPPTTPTNSAAPSERTENAEPDNTAVNARDANRTIREPKLPIDQKETQHDVDITAKIRQRVVNTEGFSINARNVKIITADGRVTLRGPVDSAAEHDKIVQIAHELAGKEMVDDQIEVKKAEPANTTTANP